MGVKGLSTFLGQYHAKYNEQVWVRECPLVIDGNNLMHFLLSSPSIVNSHLVGGDYVAYAKRVRGFFQKLKDAQIRAIVIFDGAYEPEKWKTVLKRYKDTLKANVQTNMPGNSYTPAALSTVFREILVEQGVLHYQTVLEADDTMAFVARQIDCPLLSSDSDFYVYQNVRNIPLESVDFRKSLLKKGQAKQGKVFVLAAKLLSLKRLCREEFHFSDLRFFPLAAVLLGNDRISSTTFSNLLKDKGQFDKYERIKYVFQWLGKHRDYDHVLEVILKSVKEAERRDVLNLVKSVLRSYNGENGELLVWNAIRRDLGLGVEIDVDDDRFCNFPPWYSQLHTTAVLPTYLLQILKNQIVMLQPQVEILHHPSTHALAVDVIRVTGGILLGQSELTLVTRERKNVIRVSVGTITYLPKFGSILTIKEDRFRGRAQALFYNLFELSPTEVEFTNQCPMPIKFIIICLIYFCKKIVLSKHVGGIGVALLLVYLKPILESNQKIGECKNPDSLSGLIKRQKWTNELRDFFNQFDTIATFSKSKPYEISYVSSYSSLQCLLLHSGMLNRLLGNAFGQPKLGQLNSHFVYNVTRRIAKMYDKNASEFLRSHFGGSSENTFLLIIMDKFLHILSKTTKSKITEILPLENKVDETEMNNWSTGGDTYEAREGLSISNHFVKIKLNSE